MLLEPNYVIPKLLAFYYVMLPIKLCREVESKVCFIVNGSVMKI